MTGKAGRLHGKVAFITGGGQGLGRSMAETFVREGAAVGLFDLNAGAANETAAAIKAGGGSAMALGGDVTRLADLEQAVARLAENFGMPTILINSAVFSRYAPITGVDEDVIDKMLAVGIKGVLLACRAAAPSMRAAGGGAIVNMSSVVSLRGVGYSSVYSAVKGGVDALTRALAAELGPDNIRVNAVAPSAIPSPLSRQILDEAGWEERRRRNPLGFNGDEADVTSAVLYLASDEARFVSGTVLPIDGGFSAAGMIPGVDIRKK